MFNFIFKIERWKFNKEFNVYVSSEGRIRDPKKKFLKANVNSKGYLMYKVKPQDKKSPITKLGHRLVMETFKPLENYEGMSVDHLNHNKRDNSLKNLEWVKEEENRRRAREDYLSDKQIKIVNSKRNEPIMFETIDFNTSEKLVKVNGLVFTLEKAVELLWTHKNCTASKEKVKKQIIDIVNSNKTKKNKVYLGFELENYK